MRYKIDEIVGKVESGHLEPNEATSKLFDLCSVVSSAFLVQHKETLINYGLFSTREKAENYINKNTDLFGIQEVKIA
jgi:hypothetical protein